MASAVPAGTADLGASQSDLAAGRAAIAKQLADAHKPARSFPSTEAASGNQTNVAREQAARVIDAGHIQFADDKVSKSQPHTRGLAQDFRVATVKCAKCGSEQHLHQQLPHHVANVEDNWIPNLPRFLSSTACWLTDGERWFCGRSCRDTYAHQMKQHSDKPLPVVTKVNDASYARRMYATPSGAVNHVTPADETSPSNDSAADAAGQDETTPAAPPQRGSRGPRKATQPV